MLLYDSVVNIALLVAFLIGGFTVIFAQGRGKASDVVVCESGSDFGGNIFISTAEASSSDVTLVYMQPLTILDNYDCNHS